MTEIQIGLPGSEFHVELQHGSGKRVTTRLGTSGPVQSRENTTHYCFCLQQTLITTDWGCFDLRPGMFFVVPGDFVIDSGEVLLISIEYTKALFQIGGPVEGIGRLRYIDGCTDTLLVSPWKQGEPCLNLLHIPPGTNQTAHTHPSLRAGVVVNGSGWCVTPEGRVSLESGTMFVIPADGQHSFHTESDSLLVVAFHPDSDCGPTDHDHPMINRTFVGGAPAIRTPEILT